jgi:hypothetical protein
VEKRVTDGAVHSRRADAVSDAKVELVVTSVNHTAEEPRLRGDTEEEDEDIQGSLINDALRGLCQACGQLHEFDPEEFFQRHDHCSDVCQSAQKRPNISLSSLVG